MRENRVSGKRSLLRQFQVVALVTLLAVIGFAVNAHAGRQTFNADGNFNVPAGVDSITVEAWGGGAGGWNAGKRAGTGGGGGGAYARSVVGVSELTGYPVTVGQGGSTTPTSGTSSTFDTAVVVAPGGIAPTDINGGAGGSGATGDVTYDGGSGATGVDNPNGYGGGGGSSAGTGSNGTSANNGVGAVAPAGGGNGGDGGSAAGGAGLAGLLPGGGGGGGMRTGGGVVGGAGANGRVIVNWGPTVSINQAGGQGDPTATNPILFDVVFSEAVSGFDTTDITLTGPATVSNVSGSGTTYTVEVTASGDGAIIANIAAGRADDSFGNSNFASTSTDKTVTYTTASAPTVTINQKGGQADPTNGTMEFTVVFSENVQNFDNSDVVITGDAVVNLPPTVSGGPATYTVTVSGLSSGTVIADIPAGAAQSTGSSLWTDQPATFTDHLINFDNLKPNVTINQGGAQTDPSATAPITFDVVFTEDVTDFDATDVSLSGATATVTGVSGGPTNYAVEVTPTANGVVTATVSAGIAVDTAGNTNNGSSSSDNDVEFTGAGCVDPSPSTITIPASQTVSGAGVDLTSLFGTTGNVTLFTYTIEAVGIDSPWNSSAYGSPSEVVTLVVNGTDPDCGGSAINDSNTITVDNSGINFLMHNSDTTGSSKWPKEDSGETADGWGLTDAKYGQFSCATCHTRNTTNIKRIRELLPTIADAVAESPSEDFPGSNVSFSTTTDTSAEFGDDTLGHPSSNRICEVCHTITNFHRYDTTVDPDDVGGPLTAQVDLDHANQSDCIACHQHKIGFSSPGCNSCHGDPPTSAANLVFSPSATDATSPASAGAHVQHGVFQGMACEVCHTGNTMPTVNKKIEIGFEVSNANFTGFTGTVNGGNIDVPNDGLLNGYTFISSEGSTTVTPVANQDLNCTVYCHGDWAGSAGSNTSPSWVGGTTEADCGTCHGTSGATPPETGSHVAHASSSGNVKLACNKCHPSYSDTAHLDGDVAWQLATADSRIGASATYSGSDAFSTGAAAPSASFGNCASVYCHGSDTPTWGGAAIGCDGCHSANNSLPGSHNKHYTSATVVNGNTTDNSSDAGNYVFQCGTCHDAAGTSHAYGVVSANQTAETSLNGGGTYTAGGSSVGTETGGIFSYTAGSCGFNSCHNNGKAVAGAPNVVATWTNPGGTFPTDCTACHNNNLASGSPMADPSHTAHINSGSVIPNIKCDVCHTSTVNNTERTIINKVLHPNGSREVHIVDTYDDASADATDNWNGTSCTNVYCHSDGKASLTYQTIAWGDSALCNTCHDNAGTTSTLSDSHLFHIGTDPSNTNKQFGYSCNVCHVETAASNAAIANTANHINKSRDVSVNVASGGTGTIASGDFGEDTITPRADSCGTINCHGTSSPAWSDFATVTNGDCSACHGMSDPGLTGRDTNGDTADGDLQVGAHAIHINAGSNYSAKITCDQCHNTTYTNIQAEATYVNQVNAVGHIDSALPAEITYGNIATAAGVSTAYTSATRTCTNYCHGGNDATDGLAGGVDKHPSWELNSYLSGTFSQSGDCNRCHGAPPLITGHTGSETLNDCGTCHNLTMAKDVPDSFLDPSKHIDGTLQVSATCGTCHGQLPPNTGAHPKHGIHLEQDLGVTVGSLDGGFADWNPTNYPLCATCHDLTNPDNHLDPISDILGVNKPTEAFADNYPAAGTGYPVWDDASETCSNARCHFQTTPDWNPGN